MTNEEKAKRTYPYYEDMNDIELVQTNAKRLGFIAGCEWKDEQLESEKQQWIDKACEWLEQHLYDDEYITRDNEGTWVEADFLSKGLKQAMKGGNNE